MEEEVKEEVKETKRRFADGDFIMEEVKPDSRFFNLVFMKKTKKRSGEVVIEPGKPAYGVPFTNCINRIIRHKTKKQFESRNIQLAEYLREYYRLRKELAKLFLHELPEHNN